MFYSHVETEKKKRVHFHGFMLDVHKSEFALCLHWAVGDVLFSQDMQMMFMVVSFVGFICAK